MTSLSLEFAATCETNFGEKVCICGNLSQLGGWNPAFGLLLETDDKSYPLWVTPTPVTVREGTQVEFKLCVRSAGGDLVRWEEVSGNRSCAPKGSLLIEFTDSDPRMLFKAPRRHSAHLLRVQNVRKGTEEVFNVLPPPRRNGAATALPTDKCGVNTSSRTKKKDPCC